MIDLGDTYTSSIEVYTAPPEQGGALINPSVVVLTVTAPDGTTTTPAPTSTATGKFKYDLVTAQAGRYLFRWVTTGPSTAWTDVIDVRPADPEFIVSLADVKKHLGKSLDDTTDDEELREYIEAATNAVEDIRGEVVVRRTIVEDIACPLGTRAILLDRQPVISLTSIASVDMYTIWAVVDLHVSRHGIVSVLSGPALWGLVRFTYVAGHAVIPANYALAAKIIIQHLWATQQRPSLGPRNPFGGGDEDAAPTGLGYAIPNRALQLLGGRGPLVA